MTRRRRSMWLNSQSLVCMTVDRAAIMRRLAVTMCARAHAMHTPEAFSAMVALGEFFRGCRS